MISRRRVIGIAAAAAGLGFLPSSRDGLFTWSGVALGAEARITIAGLSRDEAQRIAHMARDEAYRLEALFSLYRPDSELARLNRDGRLAQQPGQGSPFHLSVKRDDTSNSSSTHDDVAPTLTHDEKPEALEGDNNLAARDDRKFRQRLRRGRW